MSEGIEHFQGNHATLMNQLNKSSGLVVIEFMASWCPSCRRLSKFLPNVKSSNPDVKFVLIDIDDNKEIAKFYKIDSIPVLKYMKVVDGELIELESSIGANLSDLKTNVAKYK